MKSVVLSISSRVKIFFDYEILQCRENCITLLTDKTNKTTDS